jgi:hypothetical protein
LLIITILLGNFFHLFAVIGKRSYSLMEKNKFQVTISFEMNDEISALVPAHRSYINMLINKEVIDHYAVSMESKRIWITLSAEDKAEVDEILSKSPMFKYWIYEIDVLYVLDGLTYRLPHLQLN